jgi:hypothetical protein
MTAVTDVTTIYTILKGSVPSNPQILRVSTVLTDGIYSEFVQGDTSEQLAQAILDGIKNTFVTEVKKVARKGVLAPVIAQAHLPENQGALIDAAAGDIATAENTAASDLN